MKPGIHLFPFAVAMVLAAAFANWLAGHVIADACLDAGGWFDAAGNTCHSADAFVSPFDRTGNLTFWLLFLVSVLGVAWGTHALLSRLLGGRRGGQPTIDADGSTEARVPELDALERQLLVRSRDRAITVRRKRLSVATAGVMALGVWYLFAVLESTTLAMVVFLVYVGATAAERWAYANAVLGYKSLVCKLDGRIRQSEREGIGDVHRESIHE
jgi:hypothetical protein